MFSINAFLNEIQVFTADRVCDSMRHSEGRKRQAPAVLTLALGTVLGTVLTKIPISVRYFGMVFELTFLVM